MHDSLPSQLKPLSGFCRTEEITQILAATLYKILDEGCSFSPAVLLNVIFLCDPSVFAKQGDRGVEERTSVKTNYAIWISKVVCIHWAFRRTCKAGAISASGRLASAPTSEPPCKTYNLGISLIQVSISIISTIMVSYKCPSGLITSRMILWH